MTLRGQEVEREGEGRGREKGRVSVLRTFLPLEQTVQPSEEAAHTQGRSFLMLQHLTEGTKEGGLHFDSWCEVWQRPHGAWRQEPEAGRR